jgi:hypothetical protein
MANSKKLPSKFQVWVDARKRFHLSHAHIQMARELGLNPKKFGSLANHKQEPWKSPLPDFIEDLYGKRFGKDRPTGVRTIEECFAVKRAKSEERKTRRQSERETRPVIVPYGDLPESLF